jgi:hypothetical protein
LHSADPGSAATVGLRTDTSAPRESVVMETDRRFADVRAEARRDATKEGSMNTTV